MNKKNGEDVCQAIHAESISSETRNWNSVKELSIGNNGYYFIDGVRVDEEHYYRELFQQKLNKIEEKIDKILNLKNQSRELK